jgi:heat shock protein HspQ
MKGYLDYIRYGRMAKYRAGEKFFENMKQKVIKSKLKYWTFVLVEEEEQKEKELKEQELKLIQDEEDRKVRERKLQVDAQRLKRQRQSGERRHGYDASSFNAAFHNKNCKHYFVWFKIVPLFLEIG